MEKSNTLKLPVILSFICSILLIISLQISDSKIVVISSVVAIISTIIVVFAYYMDKNDE